MFYFFCGYLHACDKFCWEISHRFDAPQRIWMNVRHIEVACIQSSFVIFFFSITQRAGDLQMASRCLEESRELDLADRFLNTKSSRYALHADNIELAENTISLFTKVSKFLCHAFGIFCFFIGCW